MNGFASSLMNRLQNIVGNNFFDLMVSNDENKVANLPNIENEEVS